jgi:hypothetical protein
MSDRCCFGWAGLFVPNEPDLGERILAERILADVDGRVVLTTKNGAELLLSPCRSLITVTVKLVEKRTPLRTSRARAPSLL